MGFLLALIFTLFGLCGVFLILIVLIQRGKGGGLAGAFGGMGGHSAFGTRAGDKLMKITIGVAATWILLAMVSVRLTATSGSTTRFSGPGAILEPAKSEAEEGAVLPGLGAERDAETPGQGTAESDASDGDAATTEPSQVDSATVTPEKPAESPEGATPPSPE
jgi:preprotein translocase subunit SecG